MSNSDFGRQLVELRQQCGMSQHRLWLVTGVPQSAISRIERGLVKPRMSTIRRLADALGAEAQLDDQGQITLRPSGAVRSPSMQPVPDPTTAEKDKRTSTRR